jgi:hypothetical protein
MSVDDELIWGAHTVDGEIVIKFLLERRGAAAAPGLIRICPK